MGCGDATANVPVLVAIHDAGEDVVRVGACADEEEDDEEEGLEVEERRLWVGGRGGQCVIGWGWSTGLRRGGRAMLGFG